MNTGLKNFQSANAGKSKLNLNTLENSRPVHNNRFAKLIGGELRPHSLSQPTQLAPILSSDFHLNFVSKGGWCLS